MLENPTADSSVSVNVAPVKRYAPPNQRNRGLGRRKSGGVEIEALLSESPEQQETSQCEMKHLELVWLAGNLYLENRLERANSYTNDGEKPQVSVSRNVPIVNHGDTGSSNRVNEISSVGLIALHGCCNSEAIQLLNDRWTAAMNALNSLPDDSSERPVLYSRSGSPWGHAILPHLMMPAAAAGGLKKDFLSELRHAIRNANASSDI